MDMDMTIRIEDNSKKVLQEFEKQKDRALYLMGTDALGGKDGRGGAIGAITGNLGIDKAVDTGRLRASLSFITEHGNMTETPSNMSAFVNKEVPESKPDDKLSGTAEQSTVIVGSNVEYAEYVHNGTSKMEARPFLREGIDNATLDMKRRVEKIFKGEL